MNTKENNRKVTETLYLAMTPWRLILNNNTSYYYIPIGIHHNYKKGENMGWCCGNKG